MTGAFHQAGARAFTGSSDRRDRAGRAAADYDYVKISTLHVGSVQRAP